MDASTIDLRKRPEPGLVELILIRAEFLLPKDRSLLHAYFERGVRVDDLARLENCTPRSVRRRVRALARRMLDPTFVFVMRHIDTFTTTRRQVARLVYLHGRSRREVARMLGLGLHTVRRHCLAIEELTHQHQERAA